jgi:hypothetical protein
MHSLRARVQPQSLLLGAALTADAHAAHNLDGALARVAIVDGALDPRAVSALADARADGSAVLLALGERLIGWYAAPRPQPAACRGPAARAGV